MLTFARLEDNRGREEKFQRKNGKSTIGGDDMRESCSPLLSTKLAYYIIFKLYIYISIFIFPKNTRGKKVRFSDCDMIPSCYISEIGEERREERMK